MPPTTADASDIGYYVTAVTRKAHDRWKAALLDSSDARARAVGLALQWGEFLHDDATVQAEESRDELVQLAAGGSDPAVYAIATDLCKTGFSDPDTAGACQRISLAQWARLDPDNAVPWIAVAQAARTRGDTHAEAAAFARAAAAHKIDNSDESLLSLAINEIPPGATPLEKSALTIELIGDEAAWARPVGEIMRYCSVAAVEQDETRKECNAVAELLAGPRTTMLYYGLGGKLGGRVGWPAERVHQIAAEGAALLRIESDNEQNPWSCETLSRVNDFIDKRLHQGEVAALQELKDQRERPGQPVNN